MIDTRNRNRQDVTNLPAPTSRPVVPGLTRSFSDFMESLGEVLIDITALEVNTMVVKQITGDKFIPWEAYRDIYRISPEFFAQEEIHQSLCDRYVELRKNLELEYTLLITDQTSELYDANALNSSTNGSQILTDPTVNLQDMQTRLPDPLSPTNPEEIFKVQRLLNNSHFLRALRKMSELKAALDNRNKALLKKQDELPGHVESDALHKAVKTDMIYAQTVIQMDGDVINRYSQEIFDHPHRDLILQIHREGVTAGERQWRGLLEFIINLVQASLQRGLSKDLLPWNSSKN
ncbi:MAG TPA: hypothetical protein V6C95_03640 [Coleofasciculaceae cyanobacterium]